MESNTYKQGFKVRYSEINSRQEANLVSVLKYLEESAINHSESIGFGINKLKSLGFGWILNRWNIEIKRYPRLDERIVVETWPYNFDRLFATREFRIWDDEGNIICRASSLWILLNIERRRPARIPEEIATAYKANTERVMDDKLKNFKREAQYDWNREFEIRRSDIDTNNHVNNAVYIQWLVEGVPLEVYENKSIEKIEIIYKKEISYGGSVLVNSKISSREGGSEEYLHSIEDKKTGENLLLGRTVWK